MKRPIQKLLFLIGIQICYCHGWSTRGGSVKITAPIFPNLELEASMETNRKLTGDDLRICYNALIAADSNDDRLIDKSEYKTFVDLMGGPGVEDYNNLPIVFRSTFSILACRCLEEPNAAPDCCAGNNGRVSNEGSGPDEIPSKKEEQNLYHVCFLSESSVAKFISESGPTTSPTKTPTKNPSPPPTGIPTMNPTIELTPSTLSPTPNPSDETTEMPTSRPTFAPTNPFPTTPLPTVAPSFRPTQTQTQTTTAAPTITQSVSPTVAESAVPTITGSEVPTASPTTATPSVGPSVDPTVTPTITPSGVPSSLPSIFPSQLPSGIPSTMFPSGFPSASPSRSPPDETTQTSYMIAVRGTALLSEYKNDLIKSMNLLASQVAQDLDSSGTTSARRRLVSLSIYEPTSLDSANPIGKFLVLS